MTELKVGERVSVQWAVDRKDKGTIVALHGEKVEVRFDGAEEGQGHIFPRLWCRRLIPKKKAEAA